MENPNPGINQDNQRANSKSYDLELEDQDNKPGSISPTSARIIDEIAVKHKTALEVLANR